MMGVERKSLIISDEEKKNTAYHEAGHALVAALTPDADPLHKVTIIPRGMALGLTMQLPLDDKHSYNKEYLEAQLAILMGGRIAEEIFMHHMTTGAGNDIERATDMARKMVCEWGMSELGPLSFGKREEQIFLGREIAQHRDYSEATAIRIDEQVKKLVEGRLQPRPQDHRRTGRRAGADRAGAAGARSPGRQRSASADRRQDARGRAAAAAAERGDGTQQVIKPKPPPSRVPACWKAGRSPPSWIYEVQRAMVLQGAVALFSFRVERTTFALCAIQGVRAQP